MKAVGAQMPAIELRQRVDALVPPVLVFVEQTADRVRAEASDPEVRRRALVLKIDVVPAVYRAAFQPDPMAAALDLWLLSYQLEDCLEAGTGPCNFGPQQPIAREAARRQREAFEDLFLKAAVAPGGYERGHELVRETARRYPLQEEGSIRSRRTMVQELLKAMNVEGVGAVDVLGDVSVTLTSLSNRLNLYMDDATRLGRWHAELLAEDVARWPTIDHALTNVGRMADSVDRVRESVDDVTDSVDRVAKRLEPESLGALIDGSRDLIQAERQAVLAEVDRQRVLTLQYLSLERQAVGKSLFEGVQAERVATLAEIRKERLETLVEFERMRQALVADSAAGAFQLVDHLVWRLAQVLGGLLLLAAMLAWLALRTARAKRTASGG
jgi:hypothetical protein